MNFSIEVKNPEPKLIKAKRKLGDLELDNLREMHEKSFSYSSHFYTVSPQRIIF